MNIWRIQTDWGGIDIFPVFKKHKIAFAGTIDNFLDKIKPGDLCAITDGYTIIGVGKIDGFDDLKNIDPAYLTQYRDIKCIKFSSFYIKDDYPTINFGAYVGRRQLHKAHNDYRKSIAKLYNNLQNFAMLDNLKELLEYKKQIILQGPPGTGKTYTAKKIAKHLTQKKTINKDDVLKCLIVGQSIQSCSDYTSYIVDSFSGNGVRLRTTNGTVYEPKYSEILDAYEKQTWVNALVKNGNDSYSAAIAKYISKNLENDQIKLIQFHPAYSYEDFVRGITIQNKGTQIEYLTKNKVLGEFAHKAQQNYINSRKESKTLALESWLSNEWQGFIESIQEKLDENGKYPITSNVHIFEIEDSAFRYTGEVWAAERGHRMKFSDVMKGYLAGAANRQDFLNLQNISGSAKQHATYYFSILSLFKSFLKNPPLNQQATVEKTEEKNYVLIIDEINRANLPAVLGELIYALEYRGESVESMYALEEGGNKLILPDNLYIIGTMNTADHSVGHIDYAIRRRFAFEDVLPNHSVVHPLSKSVFQKVSELFVKNFNSLDWSKPKPEPSDYIASDFRPEDVWIGHSYFISEHQKDEDAKKELQLKLEHEIKPLLKEYVKDGILRADVTLDGAADSIDYIQKLSL